MATEFDKCMNSLSPTYLQDIFTTIKTEYTLRNPNQYNSLNVRLLIMASILLDIKVKTYGIVYLLTSKIVLP